MKTRLNDDYKALRAKILASMLITPLLPFLFAAVVGFTLAAHYVEENTLSRLGRIVDDHCMMIERFLDNRRADLQFAANSTDMESLSKKEALKEVFHNLQEKSDAFVDLGVFDDLGLHLAYEGPYSLEGKVYTQENWFKEALRSGVYISDIFLGFRNVPHFVIAVTKTEGNRTWVLRATIDTQSFSDFVEKVRIGATGEAYIISKTGLYQTSKRSGGELMEKDPDSGACLHGQRTFIERGSDNAAYVWVTKWLKNDNWMLVVRQAKSDAFRPFRNAAYLVLVIALAGGIAIVISAFTLTDRLIGRLRNMDREKGRLDQQLVIAGRMAEIGEMSAGFAHEINNPLQIIRAETALMEMIIPGLNPECLQAKPEELDDLADSIRQINMQVERCGEITSALLKFARQKEPVPEELDISSFVPEVVRMVKKKAEVEGVRILQEMDEEEISVNADASQLQQVLLNMINNALYAVKTKYGCSGQGLVKISLRRDKGDVALTVEDNGPGIPPKDLGKIFTPFFTTKPVGKGTGLGLSICYGIIDRMGGQIKVESNYGNGVRFSILLPENGNHRLSGKRPQKEIGRHCHGKDETDAR